MARLKRSLRRRGWPDEYRGLFEADFAEVQGRIFVVANRSKAVLKNLERDYRSKTLSVVDENTDNHEHFWYFDNDTIDGVRKNYTLAEAVRLAWAEILRRRFPKRRFALFVNNEYNIGTDVGGKEAGRITWEEVTPTIRLWSADLPDGAELETIYRVRDSGPETVFWPDRLDRLYGLTEIFALIEAGPTHPLKLEALKLPADRLTT